MDGIEKIIHESAGRLYFSKKQWRLLRDRGNPRTFALLAGGQIVEYTEMIPFSMIQEDPTIEPIFPEDVEYRGEGLFHHREDENHRWV